MNALDRLIAADLPADVCWHWTGAVSPNGYGVFATRQRTTSAHRAVYEALVGEVPADMQVDHLCRNTLCCNPAHLEVVTPQLNVLRSSGPAALNARKTHCPRGHELAGDNLLVSGGRRHCRTCKRAANRRTKARLRAARGLA